jgi:hypothetical protein
MSSLRRYRWRTRWGAESEFVREVVNKVIDDLLVRFDGLRSVREFMRRPWAEGSAMVLAVVSLLGLGILAAGTMAGQGKTEYFAQSYGPGEPSSSTAVDAPTAGVVTETVKRRGKTVWVVRHRGPRGAGDVVTLPARAVTVRDMATVTDREVETVTAVQPVTVTTPPVTVTVTVFETITCKPKDC